MRCRPHVRHENVTNATQPTQLRGARDKDGRLWMPVAFACPHQEALRGPETSRLKRHSRGLKDPRDVDVFE